MALTLRQRYIKNYPPDETGHYLCWLCNLPVSVNGFTVDHFEQVRVAPHKKRKLANMRPSHSWCNFLRDRIELTFSAKVAASILNDTAVRKAIFAESKTWMLIKNTNAFRGALSGAANRLRAQTSENNAA